MSDGEKRDEASTTEMAMDDKKEDSEGLEMPIAEDHAHPPDAEEQHENPPEVEKEEKNEPRAGDDHALATSVGSGEDDYESADEEAGQKLTDAPVAPVSKAYPYVGVKSAGASIDRLKISARNHFG